MAQRAISYDNLQRLCVDGIPVTFARHGVEHNVFRIRGGAEGEGGENEGESGEGGSEGGQGESGSSGEGSTETGENTEAVSKADFEALQRRMQAADRRASEAEKKVKEFEDSKKNDLEKANDKAAELEAENQKLQQQLSDQGIRIAFQADNTITWHDPEFAYREIRAKLGDDVEVGKDGKVAGMAQAIKDLAKAKSWMVKEEKPSGSSGSSQNGQRKGEKDAADKNNLRKQYPALRR